MKIALQIIFLGVLLKINPKTMTPSLQKILTILCLFSIGTGLVLGLLQLAVYINQWWAYPLGFGLSILVVLGGFEIAERAK